MLGTGKIRGGALSLIALMAGGLLTSGVDAQDTNQVKKAAEQKQSEAHGQAANTEMALEEIVVTSRRRSEKLQDIPDSVDAFSETAIERAGIESIDDAIALTPNFEMRNDQQPGVFTMTIRGVSQVRNGEPPIALVLDGVTLPSANDFTQDLFDIERIEILKGPQGALYGRNAIGGAINIVTRRPTQDFEGFFKARGGKGNDYKVSAGISGPLLGDKVLFRLAGYYHNNQGLLENVTLHEKADWDKSGGLRGRVLIDATDNLTIDLRGNYRHQNAGSAYYVNTEPTFLGIPIATGVIQGDHPGVAKVNSWDGAAKIDWETSIGTLTSVTSYNDVHESNDQEIDWTPISFLEGLLVDDVKGFTQELRLTSPDSQRLRWFVGAFYQGIDKYRLTNAFLNLNFILNGDGSPENKQLIPVAVAPQNQNWKTYSLFGQLNYDVTEKLELTLALRWDKDDRTDLQSNTPVGDLFQQGTYDQLQPKVSLAYHVTDDLLTYVTYAKGYRPGGFNPINTLQSAFHSETLDSYEAGFKSTLAGGRVKLNGAGFYIDYSKQQYFLLEVTDDGGLVQVIANGKKSQVYGFELELAAELARGLNLSAGFGYTDGEIKDFGSFATFPGGTERFNGNKLPNTSRYSLNVGLEYTVPISDTLDLQASGHYRRSGRTYWALDNADYQDPYGVADFRLGVTSETWSLTAYLENAFNEKYTEQAFIKEFSGFQTDVAWPSKPVSWGVEFGYHF